MTKQEAIEGHRKMWSWIVEQIAKQGFVVNISELKEKWCEKNGYVLENGCFACEYVHENRNDFRGCANWCPLMWGKSANDGCMIIDNHYDGLYHQILFCGDYEEGINIARKIAELPERSDNNDGE